MAVKLRNLFSVVKDMKLELIAGRAGLDNQVRWVHMVENEEISDFLEGQEVTFTTGVALQKPGDLLGLVKTNCANQASGMVVNIGPFIKDVSPEIIRFCNENNFPLFQVPWNIHMAEIMRRFCFEITEAQKKEIQLSTAIKNAIFCPEQEELYIDYLGQNEYRRDWNYCLSSIEICDSHGRGIGDDRLHKIIRRIENFILQSVWKIFTLEIEGKIVFLFANESGERIKEKLKEIIASFNDLLENDESCYVGVGKITRSARCISKSYNQALKLATWQKNNNRNSEICTYSEMGVYKLLMAIDDNDVIREYYQETIAPLEEYDKLNQTDYVKTLESYLRHSGSVKNTSLELYVHRNTINYKLKKIEDILDLDLSDFLIRQKLNIGLMIGSLYSQR